MSIRPIKRIIQAQPTIEGAGVRLRRAFGFGNTGDFDPFLLLDDFRNENPDDYRAGFPWHPHRGIETITYVLAGNATGKWFYLDQCAIMEYASFQFFEGVSFSLL